MMVRYCFRRLTRWHSNVRVWLIGWIAVGCGLSSGWCDQPIEIDPTLVAAEQQRIEAIERAMPSAVMVFVPGGAGGGSGVLISPDGYALTNFHVTSPAGSYMRCGLSDGNIYDAVIVGIDPVGDLAMIRLLGRNDFPYAEFGDSRAAQAGDWCMVIGNPFLLASNLQPTVTWGILSGVGRYQYPSGTLLEYGDCLQTDASINPGNSGGPIYDAEGRLLGIVGRASFEKRGRVNVGVGYAISINQAQNFLGYLRSGRIVDHATLGATVVTEPDGGVSVSNILESSDAYRRGLRYAAEILEIDGRVVRTANDVQNVLATFPSGWRVKLTYRLDGETRQTLVRLMGVHREDELLEKMAGALPPPPPVPDKEGRQGRFDKEDSDDLPVPEDGQEKPGGDHPHGKRVAGKDKIPEAVTEQLIERKGYANYFFNVQQQDRFIESLRSQFPGGSEGEKTAWVIEAETARPASPWAKLRVTTGKMSMLVGDRPIEAETKAELYDGVSAGSIAGMLPALDAWRRMIADGPRKFGETYYFGTMPLGGERPLRDCMVGIDGELEVRWLSHPDSGLVEVIEVFADRDKDPAELWLIRDDPSDPMPSLLDLRYGTESVLRLRVKSWQTVSASEADGAKEARNPLARMPLGRNVGRSRDERDSNPGHDVVVDMMASSLLAEPPVGCGARDAQKRVVKIYGAGGLSGLEAYQSGFLVSPDGHVATAWSYVLDVEPIVLLDDGRRFDSKIVGFEPSLELAVLKIEASELPFFPIQEDVSPQWGDPILAISNLFNIATGNEPASVMQGTIASISNLNARRGTFKTPYNGQVLILDLIANNPGAAGGAVIDVEGRLIGMLGKELRDTATGVWLNYAIPATALRKTIGDIIAGRKTTLVDDSSPMLDRDKSHSLTTLGLVLIPDVLEATPAYIDEVLEGSPAARAELHPDDLVLLVNGKRVESQRTLRNLLRTFDRRDDVELTVQRETQILPVVIRP